MESLLVLLFCVWSLKDANVSAKFFLVPALVGDMHINALYLFFVFGYLLGDGPFP